MKTFLSNVVSLIVLLICSTYFAINHQFSWSLPLAILALLPGSILYQFITVDKAINKLIELVNANPTPLPTVVTFSTPGYADNYFNRWLTNRIDRYTVTDKIFFLKKSFSVKNTAYFAICDRENGYFLVQKLQTEQWTAYKIINK